MSVRHYASYTAADERDALSPGLHYSRKKRLKNENWLNFKAKVKQDCSDDWIIILHQILTD